MHMPPTEMQAIRSSGGAYRAYQKRLPAVALFTLFAFIAYELNRRDLDEELGRRLEAIAASAATQIRGRNVVNLLFGEEDKFGYTSTARKSRWIHDP